MELYKDFYNKVNDFFKKKVEMEEVKFVENKLADDTLVYSNVAITEAGVQVFEDEALTVALADGEYELENGAKFIVADGVVEEFIPVEEEVVEETTESTEEVVEQEKVVEEETTEIKNTETELLDGTILHNDGEIVEGVVLFTDPEMTIVAEDGEYTSVDGVILVIEEGKLSAIKSVIEEEMKSLMSKLNNFEMDNKDLTEQVDELTKQVETFKKVEIDLKKQINERPAVDSIQDINIDSITDGGKLSMSEKLGMLKKRN